YCPLCFSFWWKRLGVKGIRGQAGRSPAAGCPPRPRVSPGRDAVEKRGPYIVSKPPSIHAKLRK
uniref:Uncharacterized protein n=1 Tax=Apteryx owenii TaxID=8824 RepID=A0A8B9QJG2_APTOW